MSGIEGIFSLRIVTADFYMEKPKPGLDPCFSDFRAKEIKKVPIIRIFGSSAEGQKSCMHVHGIFPYLYIPYDKKDFETLDKAVYLIASSIDKAINISLGQGSSGSQHVFKVQLVKGIPFYGYHQKEHQYLKIYLLNPRFVRRVANLLQNGAIMGKIFQPHESHVPYILQFFIDYNLYGMSFLHVPKEVLKFRRKHEEDSVPYATQKGQILDCNVATKQSTSELELDIGSGFILNRFQLITKTTTHTNPGIESIWQDERIRRQKLSKDCDEIPPLEIPSSQERPNVQSAESENFYRIGLINKLQQLEMSMDQTMNATLQTTILPKADSSIKEKKRTFNLKKLIATAVYPEECSQDDVLRNASFIEDHLSNRSIFHTSVKLSETPSAPESDDIFLDETIVDEELVLSLTQPDINNQSLREQDFELLDVMQQLEEREGENDIDLDSTLAPLSENLDLNSSQKAFSSPSMDTGPSAIASREDDSDNECLNDFTIVMDDMDELLLKLSQPSQASANIPAVEQCDGADDILRTPKKVKQGVLSTTPRTPSTPKRISKIGGGSPRTPRTPKSVAKKYAPLPLTIQSRSLKRNLLETTKKIRAPCLDNFNEAVLRTSQECDRSEMNMPSERKLLTLRKKLALSELRRKSISTDIEINGEVTPLPNIKRRKTIDLDKTHITCNLRTPRRKNERRLKVYHSEGASTTEVSKLPNKSNDDIRSSFASKEHNASSINNAKISPKVEPKKCSFIKDLGDKISNGNCTNFPVTEKTVLKGKCELSLRKRENIEKKKIHNLKKYDEEFSTSEYIGKVLTLSPERSSKEIESTIKKNVNSSITSKEHIAYDSNEIKVSRRVELTKYPRVEQSNLMEDNGDWKNSPVNANIVSKRKYRLSNEEKCDDDLSNIDNGVNFSEDQITLQTFSTKNASTIKNNANSCESKIHNVSSCNKVNKSPRVLLRRCLEIKYLNLMEDGIAKEICINSSIKENTFVSKRKCQLSLKSHKKLERRRKQKLKNFEEESLSNQYAEEAPCLSTKSERPKYNENANLPTSSSNVNKNELFIQQTKNLRIRVKRLKINGINRINANEKVPESPKTPIAHKKPYSIIVDNKYEIFPVAGPSHIDRFKIANLSTPRTPNRSIDDPESEIEDDPNMHSFYEKSFVVDSPSVFSEISLHSPGQFVKCNEQLSSSSSDQVVIISPKLLPETYEEVKQNCKIYDIPDMVHQQPFYSNYADVTHRKEVGHTVLCIPGKSLNDVEEFQSRISGLQGLYDRRKNMMHALGDPFRNDDRIREYLSSEKAVLITPCKLPPTKKDAKVWLKAREILKEKCLDVCGTEKNFEEDSPIKIRRQKIVMLMENELGESSEDIDCSMRSMSLTPLTPVDIRKREIPKTGESYLGTPLTVPKSETKSVKRRRPLKAKVSLSQKLKDICISNALEKCNGENVISTIKCAPIDNFLKTGLSSEDEMRASRESSQSNETINSEAVLAELEKSSFVKNLHSSQGSFDASFGLSIGTLNNTYGFKVNLENLQQAKSDIEHNYLTTMSLEVFVSTREDLLPNPQFDAIICIFYAIENSIPSTCTEDASKTRGFIIISDSSSAKFNGIDSDVEIKVVTNELEGLVKLLELCAQWDPDIFVGYEIEMSSWGYVMERAKYLDLNIAPLLSRVPSQKVRDFIDEDRDQLTDLDVETKLCGRILLDVWRLMRSEIALTSYTFENVIYHILHRRCPLHTHRDLSNWFKAPQTRWIVLEYYLERVGGTLELLDQLDLIGRTSEMAKLIGIQFYEVLSRGSQFRVESMMLRIAKPKNLVSLSPSVQQRAHMRAPEYLPLILEPQSRFYPDPVIVLDFQSLYPSMIMAYNYCFSTCLGRVEHLGQSIPFEFGASQLRVSSTLLKKLLENELVTISPCGVVYVKREVREGILPRMLSEVLDTRQMVKQSMKLHKSSTALQRILHSRQLGLKLIANVTYGYTAANFSGRMPCVEVGDSVVAKGRETLERAIKLVEANDQWNVRVVYGDTDSLFVLVPGRSRTEAFKIGAEIAELVTQDNPQPVKLKLEKVYQPCILQTKKRYVGYMYETPDQETPIYEAKGIETVRRDGCPAAAKMLEKCLRILFETADVSHVKNYVCRQFTKLLSGKANIQDLIFAKEFRGLNGYKPTACVPALELTRKWMQTDPRRIPRRGERVPFIVTNGPPGLPLIRLVRSPHDVLADEGLKINAVYYITKAIIPPLNRCFLLIGADVNEWFTNLPRKILFTPALSTANEIIATNATKKSTISQYFSSTNCIIDCGRQTKQGICTFCSGDTTKSIVTLEEKISKLERGYHLAQMICQACCGRPYYINCASLECPVLYVLEVKRRELTQITHIKSIIDERY